MTAFAALVVAALLGAARLAGAQPIAVVEGQPIQVSAERLAVDVRKGTAVLSGKVRLRRGELLIQCERVDARYDEAPNVTWAHATGEVVAEMRDLKARAQEAELFASKRTLVLRGGVRLWRASAWIEAREAQVDLATGRLTLEQVTGSIPVGSAPVAAADGGR